MGRGRGDPEDELGQPAAARGAAHRDRDAERRRDGPRLARRPARDEGFKEVADWFETLAKAEKSHAGRFDKMLKSIT